MLAEALSCTAYLMIADVNDGLVALVSEPNRSDMHVSIRIGTRSPLEGSAGGRAILAARTAAGRPLDPPWVVANLEGGTYGLAVPLTGVAGLEASVGIVSAREFAETEFGPRITRSAQEIARMLM
jgi:DNA-binding IclR family transcriptional regulator